MFVKIIRNIFVSDLLQPFYKVNLEPGQIFKVSKELFDENNNISGYVLASKYRVSLDDIEIIGKMYVLKYCLYIDNVFTGLSYNSLQEITPLDSLGFSSSTNHEYKLMQVYE